MRNWKKIDGHSEKVITYLKKFFLDEQPEGTEEAGEGIAHRVVLRLKDPDYLIKKRKEQSQFNADAAFERFHRRILFRRLLWGSGIAATLLIGVGCWFLFQRMPENQDAYLAEEVRIIPGEREALLTLADGQIVKLGDSPQVPIRTLEGGIQVDSARLVCEADSIQTVEAENSYYTLTIPRGGEYQLTLAEGTQVWLNSESELRFPLRFTEKERRVYLKGEAYFDVKSDRKKAFVVTTDDIEVKVYGTEFNINTRVADYVQTTLVRGAVSVKTEQSGEIMLKPDHMAQFDRMTGKTEIKEVDVSNYIGWKSGIYVFEDKSIEQITDELSLWYDVEFFFRNKASRNCHFSGSLPRYQEIDNMLKVIEKTSHVRFEVKGKTIIVD